MENKKQVLLCTLIILVTILIIVGGLIKVSNDKEGEQNALAIRVSILESNTQSVDDSKVLRVSENVELYYPTADCVTVQSEDSNKRILNCIDRN